MTFSAADLAQHANEMDGYPCIELAVLDELAREHGLSRRAAEVAALELAVVPRRYLRNVGTLAIAGQIALLRACVAVIGLGGLGGFVVEGLARMGVGRLVLVDGDRFFDHNLNRQLLCEESGLGAPKSAEAADRVRRINAAVEVIAYDREATERNLPDLLEGVDVVVDALDRLPTRLMLQDAATRAGVPMVHGAIAGAMGQVTTILPGDPGLHALYGRGPVPERGAEATLGTPAPSPMMTAALQVHEVAKLITGRGELLRGRMLFIDAFSGEARVLGLGYPPSG